MAYADMTAAQLDAIEAEAIKARDAIRLAQRVLLNGVKAIGSDGAFLVAAALSLEDAIFDEVSPALALIAAARSDLATAAHHSHTSSDRADHHRRVL